MTAAERQARRRQRVREAEAARQREKRGLAARPYQPPHGYGKAKEQLIAAGHCFERARHDFGFEEGTFLDGAFLGSHEVMALAPLPPPERKRRLAEIRQATKEDACSAVVGYMAALHVTRDELMRHHLMQLQEAPEEENEAGRGACAAIEAAIDALDKAARLLEQEFDEDAEAE
jgi:hypothetical protein